MNIVLKAATYMNIFEMFFYHFYFLKLSWESWERSRCDTPADTWNVISLCTCTREHFLRSNVQFLYEKMNKSFHDFHRIFNLDEKSVCFVVFERLRLLSITIFFPIYIMKGCLSIFSYISAIMNHSRYKFHIYIILQCSIWITYFSSVKLIDSFYINLYILKRFSSLFVSIVPNMRNSKPFILRVTIFANFNIYFP